MRASEFSPEGLFRLKARQDKAYPCSTFEMQTQVRIVYVYIFFSSVHKK